MRAHALLLLLGAACAGALAAPRAAKVAPPEPAFHHHHHHGGGGHSHGWMMRGPFSFDAEFESDGSCEVHRSGDGRGKLEGEDRCEKHIHGKMTLEKEERGGGSSSSSGDVAPVRLTNRSRGALGAGLAARLSADAGGDAPPGFVEAAVAAALADVDAAELDAALSDDGGGGVRIEAKHRFSLRCNIRKEREEEAMPVPSDAAGQDDDDDHKSFRAKIKCEITKEKSGFLRCGGGRGHEEQVHDDVAFEDDAAAVAAKEELLARAQEEQEPVAAYAWRLLRGG